MRVELTYFKGTGKYVTEATYETEMKDMHDIWDELRVMLNDGKRPGLYDGHSGYHVLVNVPDHPHDHPRLMVSEA